MRLHVPFPRRADAAAIEKKKKKVVNPTSQVNGQAGERTGWQPVCRGRDRMESETAPGANAAIKVGERATTRSRHDSYTIARRWKACPAGRATKMHTMAP